MAALDDTDRLIVEALRADGRLSMRALAAQVHLSRANVYARVARLHRDGVITGYTAVVDPVRYGYGLSAYVYLDIAQRSWKAVRRQLLSIPEVDHVALTSGEHDIVVRVRTDDAASLRDVVLTQLQEMPEIRSTQTVLIFEELDPGTACGARPRPATGLRPAPPDPQAVKGNRAYRVGQRGPGAAAGRPVPLDQRVDQAEEQPCGDRGVDIGADVPVLLGFLHQIGDELVERPPAVQGRPLGLGIAADPQQQRDVGEFGSASTPTLTRGPGTPAARWLGASIARRLVGNGEQAVQGPASGEAQQVLLADTWW